MRIAFVAFVAMFTSILQAAAGPFESSPERYAAAVNAALEKVGSDLRLSQTMCQTGQGCRFTARQVSIDVRNSANRFDTGRITVEATFRRGDDKAAEALITDTLTVLGGTMMVYDPQMPAEQRQALLLELGDAALSVGDAHHDTADVHYALSFDDVRGRLTIMAATLRAGHS